MFENLRQSFYFGAFCKCEELLVRQLLVLLKKSISSNYFLRNKMFKKKKCVQILYFLRLLHLLLSYSLRLHIIGTVPHSAIIFKSNIRSETITYPNSKNASTIMYVQLLAKVFVLSEGVSCDTYI